MADRHTPETPILRLRRFVQWAMSEGMCDNEREFEQQCGLSQRYISNNDSKGKGNLGTEILGRIIKTYPQLDLAWLCTGEGDMILREHVLYYGYQKAYEGAMMQIEALNKIIQVTK